MPAAAPSHSPFHLSPPGGSSPFAPAGESGTERAEESCEICGSRATWWRCCKLVCRGCGGISKSCADL